MWKDPIVEEVREARGKVFADCDYDMKKFGDRLKNSEKKHSNRIVTKEDLIRMDREQNMG